jgi:hypothetical protein
MGGSINQLDTVDEGSSVRMRTMAGAQPRLFTGVRAGSAMPAAAVENANETAGYVV